MARDAEDATEHGAVPDAGSAQAGTDARGGVGGGDDRPADAGDDHQDPGAQGATYHGEGVGRQERVSSGPATGTPGDPHPPEVHHPGSPRE